MAQPPADIQRQAQINAGIVALAAAKTAALWAQVDWASPAAVQAVRTLYGAIVGRFGQAGAAVAAQFYDEQRSQHALPPYTATLADPLPETMLDKIVTSAFLGAAVPDSHQPVTTSDLPMEQRVPARLDGQVHRLVLQPGRVTIAENVANDPAKPRYVRVPRGDKTCAFCVLLASRQLGPIEGPQKRSFGGYQAANVKFDKETQRLHVFAKDGTKYHDHCDCEAVPIFPGTATSDVSPNIGDYQDLYYKAAAAAGTHSDTKKILAQMRQIMGTQSGVPGPGPAPKRPTTPIPPTPAPPQRPAAPKTPKTPKAVAPQTDWSAFTKPQDIGDKLAALHPELSVDGFTNRTRVDIRAVREFAEAIDDMLTKYPQLGIEQVRLQRPTRKALENAYAWASPLPVAKTGPNNKLMTAAAITLNATKAANYAAYTASHESNQRNGWLAPGIPGKPVYSTIIHELGHAMDYAGDRESRAQVNTTLTAEFNNATTRGNQSYQGWLQSQMSRYSFTDGNPAKAPHHAESLAEAFADVEMNGPNAADTSKALHKLLITKADKAQAGHQRRLQKGPQP
jgi:hypothetical protein